MDEKIFLYYTNDLHSHFENWPKIVGHWKKRRKHHQERGETMFLIDIGDHVDRFHPIAEALHGKANVQLLNNAQYDVATIGNNEGITLTHEDLYSLYEEADFDLVVANLNNQNGPNPKWLRSYSIQTTNQGTRVGMIGLTAPFQAFYGLLGWDISSPFDELDRLLEDLQGKTDIIVLLSHLGINDDQEIARRYPGIDVIIGGHTHHLFRDGEWVENTLLTAAGKHGVYIGEVILDWDVTAEQLNKKQAYAYEITDKAEDEETTKQLEQYLEEANSILNQPVTHLTAPLPVHWFQETIIMKELVETLRTWTEADCAMLNAGVLLEGFHQGAVTRGDIHSICPHPMNPCKVSLKGDELLEVIRQAHTKRFMELKLKGFGFRGEILGRMVYAGLEVSVARDDEGNEFVRKVLLQGEPVDFDKTYYVATADTFTFGKILPEIANSRDKTYYMPELLRDLLADTLMRIS
ncbi:bifunctional metallophosphatase/5'-nucleotidase [Pontibacillus salicampi]|uniref:Bifunctional metallophosphatase/5'-nucleotidase n=1 Tax=Pontibacillus salicampi TaxID=1449801 RepID=A0ABV6LN83_9BACI